MFTRIRRFFRTPKGLLTIVLAVLAARGAVGEGLHRAWPSLAGAVGTAALIDLPILRIRNKCWEFPSGAVLTGLIASMLLNLQEPWYIVACTSAFAVASKYLYRTRNANVFNPAALGIIATFYVFDTGQDWWGALPESRPLVLSLALLFVTGIFIADRVNKVPMVVVFLGGYFLLFSVTAFLGNPARVAEIFRTPDLQAALFFAFFILTDPPTSPTKYPDQIVYAVIVAVVSYAIFEWIGAAYYLLAGVLAGNFWESWRRRQSGTVQSRAIPAIGTLRRASPG